MKKYSIYIIKRENNNEYYVGIAEDIEKRLKQHNGGNVAVTKYKRPYRLVFSQKFDSKALALKAERKIKKWKRKDFIEKIVQDGEIKVMGS